jgi:putative nucleotidyltransferase with HDIG domain
VVRAASLTLEEVAEVRGWLSPFEFEAFVAQPPYDQRHGLEAASIVARQQPLRRDLVRAALLHDIGKRQSGLGPIGRSLASAHTKFGGVPKGKWLSYLEHGQAGAVELRILGAEPLVVDFARHHHGERPGSISAEDWDVLQAADRA